MTTAQLSSRIRRHNWLQACIAVCGFTAAAPLWVLTFWLIRAVTASIVGWVHQNVAVHLAIDPSTVGLWVAVLFVAALALFGIRRARAPFDMLEFHDSAFYSTGNVRSSAQLTYFWVYMQIFLIAPYATNLAIGAIRSRIVSDADVVQRAADFLSRLDRERRWTSPTEFGDCGPELKLLRSLNLIWLRGELGEFQVRFPAGLKPGETP